MIKSLHSARKKINPTVLPAAEVKAQDIIAAMPLQELCNIRQLPQEQLAEILHAQKASISKK